VPKGDEHIKLFARHFKTGLKEFCEKAVYIGDGPVDMQIARRNNIFGIGIAGIAAKEKLFARGANTVIDGISQAVEVIEKQSIDKKKNLV
jgi:phosphoglycolate phosphatase-like HAD superfamily hydrolase